jgi:sugar phosphate isomerase/epimerase
MNPKIPIAAITDEFTPDLAPALDAMKPIGMQAAELRMIGTKNILDLDDHELKSVKDLLDARGFRVISIASPLLKCVYPGVEIDTRWQQDAFASKHTFDDQPRILERALYLARYFGAGIVRVFSYWRTVRPEQMFNPVSEALSGMAERAAKDGVIIGLENEHACNISTGEQSARVFDDVKHPNLKLVWDPANAMVSGEDPFPFGYRQVPKDRIAHVHAKDCRMNGHTPEWGPLGTRAIDWKGQIAALLADRYNGHISLETHWSGPNGDKLAGSTICGWNLRGLASA